MPNTLVHILTGTAVTKPLIRGADLKWIFLASIIPDLPWIAQRILNRPMFELPLIELRLYLALQSSLLFCLVLCIALALFTSRFRRTFAILAIGTVVHLLLDSTQTKLGNGVIFFAPFEWRIINFDLFWPEDVLTIFLTMIGALVAVAAIFLPQVSPVEVQLPKRRRAQLIFGLALVYLLAPFLFLDSAAKADLHYAKTFRDKTERVGKHIEIDRGRMVITESGPVLLHWTGETLALIGTVPNENMTISITGTFTTPETIEVSRVHTHPAGLRNLASYIGLFMIALLWIKDFIGQKKMRR